MRPLPPTAWAVTRECLIGLVLLLAVTDAPAQLQQSGPIKGFKVTEGRGRPLLMGEEAVQLRGNTWRLTGLRIHTFDASEQVAWIVQAASCVYDQDAGLVTSPDRVEVRSTDSRFQMAGIGFQLSQRENVVQLSNDVRTVVRGAREWSAAALKGTNAPGLKALTNVVVGLTNEVLEVTAQRFRLDGSKGQAMFDGDVRVTDPRGGLSSDRVTIEFKPDTRELQSVTAEGRVQAVVRQKELDGQARGDRAVYRLAGTNEIIELTGHAWWRAGDAEGGGDRMEVDNARDSLKVSGEAWIRMPRDAIGAGGSTNRPMAKATVPTGKLATKPPILSEVRCDEYGYEPGRATFRGKVRLQDPDFEAATEEVVAMLTPQGRIRELRADHPVDARQIVDATKGLLRSYRLGRATATLSTNTGTLEQFTAEGGVEVAQGTDRIIGDRATGDAKRLELLGDVRWRSESREGGARSVLVDAQSRQFTMRSNAWLQLELADMIRLRQSRAPTNALPEGPQTPGKAPRPPRVGVQCDEYAYQTTNVVFRGDVRVSDGLATWTCDELAIAFTADQKSVTSLRAERRVIIEQSGLRASGERVVYDAAENLVTMEGHPTVDMITENMRVRAEGERLIWNLNLNQIKGTGYRITAEAGPKAAVPAPVIVVPNFPKQ